MNETLFLRRTIVEGAVVLYWLGVIVQARRVRRRIGRSPNLRPRGSRERLLWVGWLFVITIWVAQPILAGTRSLPDWLQIVPSLCSMPGLAIGVAMTTAGYAGTLWCYVAMGDTWRIGIDRREKTPLVTRGPYRLVRHPIYLFQIVMLSGAALLLPSIPSLTVLIIHFLCVMTKAADEEAHQLTVHGQQYCNYLARTGRLFPKFK